MSERGGVCRECVIRRERHNNRRVSVLIGLLPAPENTFIETFFYKWNRCDEAWGRGTERSAQVITVCEC